MFRALFLFDLNRMLRARATWVCFSILVILALRDIMGGQIDGLLGSGLVPRNAPFAIYTVMMYNASWWALIFGAGIVTEAVSRDLKGGVGMTLFTTAVEDREYLLAKYLVSMLRLLLVVSGYAFGILLAPLLGSVLLPEQFYITTPWAHWLHAVFLYLLPAVFTWGTLHFAVHALSGRLLWNWILAIGVFCFFMLFLIFFNGSNQLPEWILIVDPIQKPALEAQIFPWSIEERGSAFIIFQGALMWNKLLYLAIGIATGILLWTRFELRSLLFMKEKPVKKQSFDEGVNREVTERGEATTWNVRPEPKIFRQICGIAWSEICQSWKGNIVRVLGGLTLLISLLVALGQNTDFVKDSQGMLLAVTPVVFTRVAEVFYLPAIFTFVFIIGHIFYRERENRVFLILDSLPVRTLVVYLGKLGGVLFIAVVLSLLPAVLTMLGVLAGGAAAVEWSYLMQRTALVVLPYFLVNVGIVVVVQTICRGGMMGSIISVGVLVFIIICHELHIFNHNLLLFALPNHSWAWTGFSGFGWNLAAYIHFSFYQLGVAGVLLLLAFSAWPRGITSRLRIYTERFSKGASALLVVFLGVGLCASVLYWYRTSVDNIYISHDDDVLQEVLYEKTFKKNLLGQKNPILKKLVVEVDLDVDERTVTMNAEMHLFNPHDIALNKVHLHVAKEAELHGLFQAGFSLNSRKTEPLYPKQIEVDFQEQLDAGAELVLKVETKVSPQGYLNEGYLTSIFKDGSLVPAEWLPQIGYAWDKEPHLVLERHEHELESKWAGTENLKNLPLLARPGLKGNQSNAVHLELRITHPAHQTVIAPGE